MLSLRMLGILLLVFLESDADSTCSPELNPLHQETPEIIAEFGSKVYVNCTRTNKHHAGLFWKDNDTEVETDKYFISKAISMTEWNAEVQCKIKLNATSECSKDLNITVYMNPEDVHLFYLYGQSAEAKTIHLQCDILNIALIENLRVRWYKDNQIFNSVSFSNTSESPVSVSSGVAVNVSRGDNGAQFRCEVQLDFAQHGRQFPVKLGTYNVSVHYAPEFKEKNIDFENVIVGEGENVTLNCEAEGNPSPVFYWAKNGNRIKENTPILYINQVNTNATYSCNASNSLATIGKQIDIHVVKTTLAPSLATPKPPPKTLISEGCHLTLTPAELVVEFGAPASVNCSTSALNLEGMGWEAADGGTRFEAGPNVTWKVNHLKDWSSQPKCYAVLVNNATCEVTPKITLYKTPENVSVFALDGGPMVEDAEYRLNCNVINVTPVRNLDVKWYIGNEIVQTQAYANLSNQAVNVSSTFTFIPNRDHNGANFTCKAELHLGPNGQGLIPHTFSAPYFAVVYYKPRIQDCPSHYAGVEGGFSMDMMPCRADGNPQPTLLWYYQGTQINASEPLNRTQSGLYTAEFVNGIGNCRTSVVITIEYGPSFNCDSHLNVEENGIFQAICEPRGIPMPVVSWSKDGKAVASSRQLTKNDSGQYTLTATNKLGTANHTLSLNVLYAPKFKTGNQQTVLTVGENVTLECIAEGNPIPVIVWLYQRLGNVRETTSGYHKHISVTGATFTNEGVYICIATNCVGNVTRSVTLKMMGEPLPLWILSVLISTIILILFIIIISMIYLKYWKKHKKYSFVSNRAHNDIPLNSYPTKQA